MADAFGSPVSGQLVRMVLASNEQTVATCTSDAQGTCVIVENSFVGQSRCIVASKTGWQTYYEQGCAGCYNETRICNTAAFNFKVQFRLASSMPDVQVFGGENGYVQPDRGEVATFVFRYTKYPTPVPVQIRIFNNRGKKVHENRTAISGAYNQAKVTWDGRDDSGVLVPTGIYIVHVDGNGLTSKKLKVAIVRR